MSGLSSVQIQALVRDMDTSMRKHRLTKRVDKEKFRAKVAAENETLYNLFPTVFEMHIEGKLDGTFFEMLKLKHKIEKGEMTEDEASVLIGQKLFDRYVAPVVGDAPIPEKPLSYSDYYKQFEDSK
jgi:ATP-dependent protease HslVU (ClpYQ) ATPase subunit